MSLALPRVECQTTGLPGRPLPKRASRPAPTLVPGKTRTMEFRPLHDRVLVRRVTAEEKTAGGIIIPDTAKEQPQEGEVISVRAAEQKSLRKRPGSPVAAVRNWSAA